MTDTRLTPVESLVVSIFALVVAVVWVTEWLQIAEDHPVAAWILLMVVIA